MTSSPRSASLVLRVFVDAPGGSTWVARVSAFTHPGRDTLEAGPLTRVDEVVAVVRSWVEQATCGVTEP